MNFNYISSKQNSLIKKTNSLYKKKFRDKENLFVIEGLRGVELVCEHKIDLIDYVIATEEYANKLTFDLDYNKLFICSDEVFNSLPDAKNAQGILAVCKKVKYDINDVINNDKLFLVVCENLQDPGNAGTLIRMVDSVGADGIIFTNGSVDIYNPKVVRSTAGSILNVNIYENFESDDIINKLKENGVTLYGTSLQTESYHYDEEYQDNIAIFLGNEGNGIKDSTLEQLDCKIKIPMCGKAESLNVGVAGSIIAYEILRQKRKGGK